MTDDHDPMDEPIDEIDELDDLLSAHLDAELELLEQRPDLDDEIVAARLRELRGVGDAIRASVPPVPTAVVDDQIAAALRALPQPADAPASLTAALAARRSRRLADRLPMLGAAAAVLLVIFGLAVVVTNLRGSDDSDSDATAEVAANAPTDFRRPLDAGGETDADEAFAAEAAPATTQALTEADLADEAAAVDGGDDSATTGAAASEETEEPAETEAPNRSGEELESAVPIDLPEKCTTDLVTRLDADEVLSTMDLGDGTAEIVLRRAGTDLTVIIDPGRCDGTTDPILDGPR